MNNHQLIIIEISKTTDVSPECVHMILQKHLKTRKLSAQWVPRLLTNYKNAFSWVF